jgi:DNA-binding beta-propeller fold protein YncE
MQVVVAGTGDYRYRVVQDWGHLPKGWQFGTISSVAVDSQDRVYAYTRGQHPVIVFDRDGNLLASWGEGSIVQSHGMFISSDDFVFLVDWDAHQVLKFTPTGKLVLAIGERHHPSKEAPFNHPTAVAVSPTGEIYVADGYGNSRVHKFSPDGRLLLSWGSPGKGPGQFRVPHSIWVDRNQRAYVCDRENDRVQIFTSEGEFITEWTDFCRPNSIYIDSHDAVYVTDFIPRFSIFDVNGNLLSRGKVVPGRTASHGVWGDSRGDLYFALPSESRIIKYVATTAPLREP